METVKSIWNFELQIIPVIISILIVEIPNWIRRAKKLYYIPIYFSIFPLRELNPNLSYYLGEDYFIGYGSRLNDSELKRLKNKITRDSIFSIVISALLIPILAGFIYSFYLTKDVFIQSVIVIGFYKGFNIIRAISDFKYHAVATKQNIVFLIVIYLGYLGVFIQMIFKAFTWTYKYTSAKDWSNLFSDLSDLIFNQAIAQFLILALLSAIFVNLLTNKDIRDENLNRD